MEPTTPSRRRLCAVCERPSPVCLCHALPHHPIPTATQVVILQHPHEGRHKLSTVPVLSKCLLNSTTLISRRLRPGLSPLLDTRPPALYLFPSTPSSSAVRLDDLSQAIFSGKISYPDGNLSRRLGIQLNSSIFSGKSSDPDENSSSGVADECKTETCSGKSSDPDEKSGCGLVDECKKEIFLGKLSEKLVLIVFDGTWKHAKEMVAASEEFLSPFATRVCLDTDESVDGASIYDSELVLRKEPCGGCVSTMEAVARCLRVIEPNGEEIEGKLIGVLREMVRLQAGFLKAMKPRVKLGKKGKERETKKDEGV